ncbi:MAG: beta-eliminating lyase-related protein [Eubacteriales bacterium]|nr:beta-eliminating lyase-related protein [Eubacteriales bacterium]
MTRDDSICILQSQLEKYNAGGLYPFHMPGHKRRMAPAPGLPYTLDVTEVPGTDDLHDARGILREAMQRTAALWGAERTWYVVNGSTCGLLAGIRALARRGSEVLCARNCHKAVCHALELAGFRVHWIFPDAVPGLEICGGISAAQVEAALKKHPLARALILTSPTYEGILSGIRGICEVCHARNIPVLVDEAHGAHLLPLSEEAGFPAGAIACGADVVVQSPHKTLPSLTQTALLHLQGSRVDPRRIEEELDVFETSSPSYPLLASLDGCTGILRDRGEALFAQWALRIGRFDAAVRGLQRIRIPGHTAWDAAPVFDPGKILIDARGAGMTGKELALVLRERYRMETEMSNDAFVLAMTSPCDEEDALDRLAAALLQLDAETGADGAGKELPPPAPSVLSGLAGIRSAAVCTMAEAASQDTEEVPVSDAAGRVCAEYIYFYPPGIPFLVPGEVITGEHCRLLLRAQAEGLSVYRRAQRAVIRCLRE